METNQNNAPEMGGVDPFQLGAGINQKITPARRAILFAGSLLLTVIFLYDFFGFSSLIMGLVYEFPKVVQYLIAGSFGALIALAIVYSLHRVVWVSDPGFWKKHWYLSVAYFGAIAIVQVALATPVEKVFFRGDINRWKAEQNAELHRQLLSREVNTITAAAAPKLAAIATATTATGDQFRAKREADKAALLARRNEGARDRSDSARTMLAASARAARTRTGTIASLRAADAAQAAAAAGAATTAATSRDAYELEMERKLQGFDVETETLLVAKIQPLLMQSAEIAAARDAEIKRVKKLDLDAFVKEFGVNDPADPQRRVFKDGLQDDDIALGALRGERPHYQYIVIGLALGLVLALLVFKAFAAKYLYLSEDQIKHLQTQRAVNKAIDEVDEFVALQAARRDHGLSLRFGEIVAAVRQYWHTKVTPHLDEIADIETRLTKSVADIPDWDPRLRHGDPRTWETAEPWHRFNPQRLVELGWEDPTLYLNEARAAYRNLFEEAYPRLQHIVEVIIPSFLYSFFQKTDDDGKSYADADYNFVLEMITYFSQPRAKGSKYTTGLIELLSLIRGDQAVIVAVGMELPAWPLQVTQEALEKGNWITEEELRRLGWRGKSPKALNAPEPTAPPTSAEKVSENKYGKFGDLALSEDELPTPRPRPVPQAPSLSLDLGQKPEDEESALEREFFGGKKPSENEVVEAAARRGKERADEVHPPSRAETQRMPSPLASPPRFHSTPSEEGVEEGGGLGDPGEGGLPSSRPGSGLGSGRGGLPS